MPLQHAVLALLADGPNYGYQLRASLDTAVGPQWGLNIGHVYQVLDRLRRDGLISATTEAQPRRPDRTVYQLTAAGRTELDAWLAQPVVRTGGYRDDVILKLFAAARRDVAAVRAVVRTQRQQHLAELKSLTELRADANLEPLNALLLDSAVLSIQSRLHWLDRVDDRAETLITATSAADTADHGPTNPTPVGAADADLDRTRTAG